MTILNKLKELNIIIPDAPSPVGAYVASKKVANFLFISNHNIIIRAVLSKISVCRQRSARGWGMLKTTRFHAC